VGIDDWIPELPIRSARGDGSDCKYSGTAFTALVLSSLNNVAIIDFIPDTITDHSAWQQSVKITTDIAKTKAIRKQKLQNDSNTIGYPTWYRNELLQLQVYKK